MSASAHKKINAFENSQILFPKFTQFICHLSGCDINQFKTPLSHLPLYLYPHSPAQVVVAIKQEHKLHYLITVENISLMHANEGGN